MSIMKAKRVLALLLAALMAAAMLAACSGGGEPDGQTQVSQENAPPASGEAASETQASQESAAPATTEAAGTSQAAQGSAAPEGGGTGGQPSGGDEGGYSLPLTAEDATLICWGFPLPDWKVDNLEENQFTQWLEGQTGVKLDFVMGPASDRDTKLSLLLSSGEYPGIIFNPGFTPSQQQIYGANGIILPLNDYIEKYGVETKAMYEQVPEIRAAVERDGGVIYVMPTYMDSPHDKSYSRLWIYQPWLDALGLSMPATTEEYLEVARAFRDGDPNGNGQKDELPFVAAEPVWFSEPTPFFMNSFVYFDNSTQMNIDNGTVVPVYAHEAYREGLRYLNAMYDEGLMMPQSFSQNDQALRQLLSNDTMIVGSFAAHAPFVYCDEEVYRDLAPVPPLKGPGGVQYTAQYYNTGTDGTVITNACKDPELAFKLLDFLYSEEATTRKSQGPMGVAWEWNTDDSLVNEYGVTPTWLTLQTSDETAPNDRWSLLGNGFQPYERSGIYVMNMTAEAIAARESSAGKVDGYVQIQKAAMDVYNHYFPPAEMRMPQVLIFSEDDSATLADMELALQNKISEMRTQFITGNASLDSDWENYLDALRAIGMDEVLALYQAAYDRRR
jgi:putative aldouronate transport system substrate-binding protein